eukprot:gnl/TRDRNA2_/TRDRNA2_156083_c0_seq1.p1 gnl/TRDRNA2_/TRDRNA2_156083_c0~~gnl/TRDRNA2_/TRDRNA2_156083_c0_seq1.p1  ORF type:complete len:383 (+),score=53.35 gnl/TRDRNA2_/TRDRNA2_156083_c0_seq1:143-1150(+)
MAPEVIRGHPHGTGADCWSLGVTIYDMLFGTLPFADSRACCRAEYEVPDTQPPIVVPGSVRMLLSRLFRLDPARRARAEELIQFPFLADAPREPSPGLRTALRLGSATGAAPPTLVGTAASFEVPVLPAPPAVLPVPPTQVAAMISFVPQPVAVQGSRATLRAPGSFVPPADAHSFVPQPVAVQGSRATLRAPGSFVPPADAQVPVNRPVVRPSTPWSQQVATRLGTSPPRHSQSPVQQRRPRQPQLQQSVQQHQPQQQQQQPLEVVQQQQPQPQLTQPQPQRFQQHVAAEGPAASAVVAGSSVVRLSTSAQGCTTLMHSSAVLSRRRAPYAAGA